MALKIWRELSLVKMIVTLAALILIGGCGAADPTYEQVEAAGAKLEAEQRVAMAPVIAAAEAADRQRVAREHALRDKLLEACENKDSPFRTLDDYEKLGRMLGCVSDADSKSHDNSVPWQMEIVARKPEAVWLGGDLVSRCEKLTGENHLLCKKFGCENQYPAVLFDDCLSTARELYANNPALLYTPPPTAEDTEQSELRDQQQQIENLQTQLQDQRWEIDEAKRRAADAEAEGDAAIGMSLSPF